MKIKGAIFDMDGTLLESMHIWETVGSDYLKSQGIDPAEGLREQIKTLSLRDCATYFYEQYTIALPIEEIMTGINNTIAGFYANEVWLKPGALQLLEKLEQQGVQMCIATATDRELVESALERTNIGRFFGEILTCTEVGAGKENPLIFEKALEIMGVNKSECVLFEDALHAIETAKKVGFTVIAVQDLSAEQNKAEIKQLADYYYESLEEIHLFD